MEELLQGISKADFPALCAVDQPEARLIDRDSSNPLLLNYHYFFILQHAASLDAASRSAAIKECSVIAGKILSRMFRDKLAECRDPFTDPSGLKGLNRDCVSLKSDFFVIFLTSTSGTQAVFYHVVRNRFTT